MGFVYHLGCPACGFHHDFIFMGLVGGSAEIAALAQEQIAGTLLQLHVAHADVIQDHGGEPRTDDEWFNALESLIEKRLGPTERSISPHEAFCPKCRGQLEVRDAGFT